ncbi:hypothetical protein BS47DRAFT_1371289 [Hydnum rufescens UP504]|uniref:Magnesium-transporting ATPase, P-type 1 n=1 Tax=Hydnum rufescens UP504 TaxID=1448309 RepID=A0A9P6DWN6_9AGAM|nr:hypothetical protein BS47DRAFT_1371289 [Hydnum rufescens UP504]
MLPEFLNHFPALFTGLVSLHLIQFLPKLLIRSKPTEKTRTTKEPSPPDKRERVIIEKLVRFARVPASSIFDLEPGSSPLGLSDAAARAALQKNGPNVFASERGVRPWSLLFQATANPFNCILTVLAIVSVATGDKATFTVMMLMVVASTTLRFWQELKSVSQAVKLLNSVSTRVRVLRANQTVDLDRKEVVPGDVLVLTSGDVIPGDCVLFSSEALTIAQASLTGELMPVEKAPRVVLPPPDYKFEILDNENICLAGTSVTTGSGRAMVILTGTETYMASIAKDLEKKRPANAMQIGMIRVSYILMTFMAVMAPIVFVIQGVISKNWKGALLFAIAVAVGITPEMLPMIVAANLAVSATRVARKKVIVKRLDAIQNLGAVTILCSDQDGDSDNGSRSSVNSMFPNGEESILPLKLAYLNSALQTGPGVQSMLPYDLGEDITIEEWEKLSEVPFDATRRLLSVLVTRVRAGADEKGFLITKGAVEEVLDRCTRIFDNSSSANLNQFKLGTDGTSSLTTDHRTQILEMAERFNGDGLRLVAVACKSAVAMHPVSVDAEDENDLVFVGFVGFLDPLKPDAADAIAKLTQLGVQVRILTGDVPAVAAKVARDLGILPSATPSPDHVAIPMEPPIDVKDLILTGSQLAALSADAADLEAFDQALERCLIFAKMSPHQKLQIVEALRRGGTKAVAFLGDGVNDALAIRAADVGISVDSGTEIAKEAADVILLEKSLDVIVDGIVQGRITFLNTIKYVKMACSSNFGNVFSVLVASAWLPYQPMRPLQLLFQNLLYDFSQGTIPWDNVDPEYVVAPKGWDARSIARFMICMGPTSSVFDICTFVLNWYRYDIRTAKSPHVSRAQTTWFIEALHHPFPPDGQNPFIQSRASLPVVFLTSLMAAVAMVVPYIPPFEHALKMAHPKPEFYGFLVAILASYALLVQLIKTIYQRVFHEWL